MASRSTNPGSPAAAFRRAGRGQQPAAGAGHRAADRRRPGAAGAGQAGGGSSSRRDAVTNYEVDKTVRVTRNATGMVKRLNAAVVVNHRSDHRRQGQDRTTPLSADEIDKLTALVQEAWAEQQDRGDSVKRDQRAVRADRARPKVATDAAVEAALGDRPAAHRRRRRRWRWWGWCSSG